MHYGEKKSPPRRLWRFHGGLHLPDNKSQSTGGAIETARLPKRLVLPLQQHIGDPAQPVVKIGDHVLKGQLVAKARGYISAPVHAPSSGNVVEIENHPVAHPSGLSAPCIVIETDGQDRWADLPPPMVHYRDVDPALLRERVRQSGIVGLGGAAFPTSVKLTPGPDTFIHTLIINGAECEPYITCDDMLMRERSAQILDGIQILLHLLAADRCLIGIEDNKPEAIAAMKAATASTGLDQIEVVSIPTLYPSGGEKQLIRVLTGSEVPTSGIPAQIRTVCHNVGTVAAVADAVLKGRPLISRIVTLTGEGVAEPGNMEALIGTPVTDLIDQRGGYTASLSKLILGGPMMGFVLPTDEVPITKGANCLLAASPIEAPNPGPATPCIRCGECARVCPLNLLPQQMYWYTRSKDLDKVQDYKLFDCIECGCCAHVCPSHIPLVQYYRFAKMESWAKEEERRKSDLARQRHDARLARLERLEQERKSRLRKKRKDLRAEDSSDRSVKKAAIEAAMRRVAEKKAGQTAKPAAPESDSSDESLSADRQPAAETPIPGAAETTSTTEKTNTEA